MFTNSSNPCLITISETTESKLYWLSQGLGKGHEAQLESADVILVPEKKTSEKDFHFFSIKTLQNFLNTYQKTCPRIPR